jgi:hypothetical protein
MNLPDVPPATSLLPACGRALFWAGLVCGVLDIGGAFCTAWFGSGVGPVRLLQGVAGGLLGRQAATYGLPAAALGLALHFCVAYSWTLVFILLARRWSVLLEWAWVAGPLYGVFVFLAMNQVVLPALSWLRSLYLHTPVVLSGPMGWPQLVVHMLCVGLAIALTVRRLAP